MPTALTELQRAGPKARTESVPDRACVLPGCRTTWIEQVMLFATVALLPLENQIPSVMGIGFMFFVFGILSLYVLVNRASMLDRVWMYPVFLAAYGLLLIICLLEITHPHSDYSEIFSVAQMIAGAVLIASLCRDQPALRAGIYGCIVAGLWVTVYLMLTSYGKVSGMSASDFSSASAVREEAFETMTLVANLNTLAFFAAQGAVGALALALKERSSLRRSVFALVMIACVVGAFLPMSRGGILVLGVASAAVIATYGLMSGRLVAMVALLALGIWILVPEAVFSRLVFQAQSYEPGKLEGRTQVYTAVIEQLPEYIVAGVGAGHFWKSWGRRHGFSYGSGVIGSHNCFSQTAIYWGVMGLLGVLAVIWQGYRHFPRPCNTDALKLALLGTTISLLPYMMVMHQLYAKQLSIGLGFLVGAAYWIWPRALSRGRVKSQFPVGLSVR
jgi:hypothetical protein